MTLGFGLFTSLSPAFSLPKIVLFQLTAGVGVGLALQSPLIAPENVATATATLGSVRSVGCSMSIMLGRVLFQNGIEAYSTAIQTLWVAKSEQDFEGFS